MMSSLLPADGSAAAGAPRAPGRGGTGTPLEAEEECPGTGGKGEAAAEYGFEATASPSLLRLTCGLPLTMESRACRPQPASAWKLCASPACFPGLFKAFSSSADRELRAFGDLDSEGFGAMSAIGVAGAGKLAASESPSRSGVCGM
jgi:hypothetical protein